MKMSVRLHGVIDYLIVIFLLFAPSFFELPVFNVLIIYLMGFGYLVFTVLTHYSAGLVGLIELRIHGWVELILSLVLISLSFLETDTLSHTIMYLMRGFGLTLFIIWVFSDYTNRHWYETTG